MFIEKLSKKELVDFIKKIGYEPKQEMPDIKLNKDGDALVLISCEPTKLQKDLYQQVLNYSGIGYFCDNTHYYMGTTLALTDFDCYDILHMEKEYHDDWQQFMYKKFGDKYVKALDAAIEKQRHRKQNEGQEK